MEPRPFHETIVEAIGKAKSSSVYCILDLILGTKIPAGHDEIIAAIDGWNNYSSYTEEFNVRNFSRKVKEHVLKQKELVEKKEKISVDLDALLAEAKKLVNLLEDRQEGLFTWHEFLAERMRFLKEIML